MELIIALLLIVFAAVTLIAQSMMCKLTVNEMTKKLKDTNFNY